MMLFVAVSLDLHCIGLDTDGLTTDFCKIRLLFTRDLFCTFHVSVTLFSKSNDFFSAKLFAIIYVISLLCIMLENMVAVLIFYDVKNIR